MYLKERLEKMENGYNNNNNNNKNFIYTVNNPISIAAGINGRTVLVNIITNLSTQ